MKLIRNPEVRGVLIIILVIGVVGLAIAAATGKIEKWFGITWFSGPRLLDKIVFVSERSGSPQLYAMNTDGSGRKALTKGASVLSAPAISPRGNRIAFIGIVDQWPQVMTIGAEGGTPDQLTAMTTPKSLVGYSPDGEKLSYIASGRVFVRESNSEEASVVLPTEEELHRAMMDPQARGEIPPYRDYAWGPDSARIAGVKKTEGGSEVVVYLAKPGAEANEFPPPQLVRANVAGLAWAKDEPVLAVTENIEGTGWLVLFDAESPFGPESNNPGIGGKFKGQVLGKPAVSPDGMSVVFPFKDIKTGRAGMVLTSASGEIGWVTAGEFSDPAFSADGSSVLGVESAKGGKSRDVVLIDASDGKVTKLTRDGKSHSPIWTPVSEE